MCNYCPTKKKYELKGNYCIKKQKLLTPLHNLGFVVLTLILFCQNEQPSNNSQKTTKLTAHC